MSFSRHGEIYPPDVGSKTGSGFVAGSRRSSVRMSLSRLFLAGCPPAVGYQTEGLDNKERSKPILLSGRAEALGLLAETRPYRHIHFAAGLIGVEVGVCHLAVMN